MVMLRQIARVGGLALRRCVPLTVPPAVGSLFSQNLTSRLSQREFRTSSRLFEQAALALKEEESLPIEKEHEQSNDALKQIQRDNTFASLKPHITYPTFKALTSKPFGYQEMSDVQERVLHLLPNLADAKQGEEERQDLLVKARTGTGKTLAFLVPAIEARLQAHKDVTKGHFSEPWKKLLKEFRPDFPFEQFDVMDKHGRTRLGKQFLENSVGTLILSPTRELATQIANEAIKLHTHHKDLNVQLLVGGASRAFQLKTWSKSRPDVVVATPGRMLDLLKEESMVRSAVSACQTLILDEADTLLEMGFRDDIQSILSYLPSKEQRLSMLFSATVSKEIRAIAQQTLSKKHHFIDCVPPGEENVHKHIPQYATVLSSPGEQIRHIVRLIAHDQIRNAGKSKTIVFCPTTRLTELMSRILSSEPVTACFPAGRATRTYEIHSQLNQSQRFKTSDRFRMDSRGASVLVSSDVSARGVDYPGTTRIIQIGVPATKDQYIHRIGRTGRAGKSGRADIVLQRWEAAFVSLDLSDLPIEQLPVESLQEELEAVAKEFDEEPTKVIDAEVWKTMQEKPKTFSTSSNQRFSGGKYAPSAAPRGGSGPVAIRGPLSEKLSDERIDSAITQALSQIDEEMIKETFTSLLGFYSGRTQDLRTSKGVVLDELKRWAVESCGLDKEPYVSESFLNKIGFGAKSRSSGPQYGARGGRGGHGGGRDRGRDGYSRSGPMQRNRRGDGLPWASGGKWNNTQQRDGF